MKKYIIVIILCGFFIHVSQAYAGFQITELMYDVNGTDTDREWVEVENTGTTTADLSTWFLFSGNSKHALVPQGVSTVDPGAYAVIVQNVDKFKTDWPNYSGLLFDSSWTGFNNEAGTIVLKDPDLNIVSSVTYSSDMGASGDGNSLQNIGGTFSPAPPTPGTANNSVSIIEGPSSGSDATDITSTTESSSISSPSPQEIKPPKISAKIVAKTIAVTGVPLSFNTVISGYQTTETVFGKFVWNFGDGMARTDSQTKKFSYTYQYPGEYVVTLSYYQSYSTQEPTATDRLTIKVVPASITISSVGDIADPFVELQNTSTYEIPLSGWKLQGIAHYFIIPDGTILLPLKKLKLSPSLTYFNIQDLTSLTLEDPSANTIAVYPSVSPPEPETTSSPKPTTHTTPTKVKAVTTKASQAPTIPDLTQMEIPGIDTSQVVNLNTVDTAHTKAKMSVYSFLPWIGFGTILAVGIVGMIFLARRKYRNNEEDDDIDEDIDFQDLETAE
jgi:hypothetical protein